MKYIKTFELRKSKDKTIYENEDFKIGIHTDGGSKYYASKVRESVATLMIATLVREKSKYLNDENFRNIEFSEKDIREILNLLELDPKTLGYDKLKNIKNNKSGCIRYFLDNDIFYSLSEKVHVFLIHKFYSIICDVIKECKTFGDVIDKFTTICKEMDEDLFLDKYNL